MNINRLLKEMLLPQREVIINRSFSFCEKPALLLALTEQQGEIKLWTLHQIDQPEEDFAEEYLEDNRPAKVTLRQEKQAEIDHQQGGNLHVSLFDIQGFSLDISSSASSVLENDWRSFVKLQHFAEHGADFSSFDQVPLRNLVLSYFRLADGCQFPQIDAAMPLDIVLHIAEDSQQVQLSPPLQFNLQQGKLPPLQHSFYDEQSKREIAFFLAELLTYDIRTEMVAQLDGEEAQSSWQLAGLDEVAIAEMRTRTLRSLDNLCPAEQELLLLQYYADEDTQLNFFLSDVLDSQPNHNGNGVFGVIVGSDKRDDGRLVRTCRLSAVPKGFSGSVQVELFSWYRKIPAYRIKI